MTEQTHYRPTSVSAPGETLAELLDERNITQAELARRLGRPTKTINEIIKGKAMITPETALQLERALGVPADFWLARETAYRGWLARQSAEAELLKWTGWLKELPVKHMIQCGWIQRSTRKPELVASCLAFFGVASVDAWREHCKKPQAAFRASAKTKSEPGAVAAWLRQGEREAHAIDCRPFEAAALRNVLPALRALTREGNPACFVPQLVDLCRASGVAVTFVRAPAGCPVSGAARWLTPDRALIQLSLRYKTNDQMWFTFFHELGHILLHGRSLVFIDDPAASRNDEQEDEANEFAADTLIPPSSQHRLHAVQKSAAAIERLADELGVAPGIVVGRMQREKLLPWTHLNALKVRYELRET
jgi:addiction module HigA family antidote